MSKKILILLISSLFLKSSFAEEPQLNLRVQNNHPKINLNLPKIIQDDRGTLGMALLFSGFALVAGSILEGDLNYTTAYYNSNGKLIRDTKPFLEQTPRQILFFTGTAITITGLYISIDEMKLRIRR